MAIRYATLLLFLFLDVSVATAQITIEGRVTDAETGAVLPAANLHIEGTYQGTVSNADGAYALRVRQLPATIIIRYIGYETRRLDLTTSSPPTQDIRLNPVTYEMEELVVSDEDPAYNIMRKVIEKKQQWRATLETYQVEAYTRFTLENDSGIVSIMESLTDAFWDKEEGTKEIVLSRRMTNNLDIDEFMPAAIFVSNLYDDDIEVAGFNMVGVTHPDALKHYKFALVGTRFLDEHVVYDIAVEPKNKLKSAFVGKVSVLDDVYALLDVELRPGDAFLFPPPIRLFDITYRQQFSNFGQDYWLPVDMRTDMDLKVAFRGLLAFPVFRIRQSSRLTDYQVNVALPDSLYEMEDFLAVDSMAVEADTLLDREGIGVPLSIREVTAYETIDSTMTIAKAYEPTGPLARFVKAGMNEDEEDQEAQQRRNNPFSKMGFSPELWYNRVDALHLGLAADLPVGEVVSVRGAVAYKTGLKQWAYGGGLGVRFGHKRRAFINADYRNGIDTRYKSRVRTRGINAALLVFGADDYYDYFANERIRVGAGYRIPRLYRTRVELYYTDEKQSSVQKTTDWTLFRSSPQPDNPSIDNGRLRSLGLRLSVNEEDLLFGITGQRALILDIERSSPDLIESDFTFWKYQLVFDWYFNTFLSRRLLPNRLDFRILAGTYAGTLPSQRFGIIDGSGDALKVFGGLRTLIGRPYEGEQYVALLWEHNFRTMFWELLGWRGLATYGLNLIVHGGHGKSWVSTERRAPMAYIPFTPTGFHHEIGLSLSGILDWIRIDVTQRLDTPETTVGIGIARIF